MIGFSYFAARMRAPMAVYDETILVVIDGMAAMSMAAMALAIKPYSTAVAPV